MASVFTSGLVPTFTKEQTKMRRTAWKPSTARLKMQKSGPVTVVFRSETRKVEIETFEALQAEAAKA